MNEYEIIKRKLKLDGKDYERGMKVTLPDELYLSHQDSLQLVKPAPVKKTSKKKVKSNEKIVRKTEL